MTDLRIALRSLAKSPGPTVVVVLTLAVAIGATTIIYSTIDAVWHAVPVVNRERVVFVASTDPRPSQSQSGMSGGLALAGVSIPDLVDWTARSSTIEEFAGFRFDSATLTGLDAPARVSIMRVTANLPSMWGFAPALGRNFRPDESRPGAEPVAMLTHRFWERQFSSNGAILGSSVRLNGTAHTIVGVLSSEAEKGIFGTTDFLVVHPLDPARSARDERRMFMTARLKEDVTRAQASADLEAIANRLKVEYPQTNAQTGVVVRPLVELVGGENPFLFFLLSLIAALVVAMACANVSNVILAQVATRRREVSLRSALGANRFDHIRRVMVESFVLSFAAGGVGLVLGWWGVNLFRWLAGPERAFFVGEATLNGRVLAAGMLTSFVVPLVIGLFPAINASKPDVMELKEGNRSAGSTSGGRLRRVLVGVQVALAMILMIQIGLVGRTAWRFSTAETGFDPSRVLTFRIDLSETRYSDTARAAQFYRDLLTRIDALPGVASAAAINRLPVADRELGVRLAAEGAPPVAPEALPFGALATVTRDYVETMRVRLLRGRSLTDADFTGGPPVALVSEEAARRLWSGGDPIGKRVTVRTALFPDTPLLVVGVVADVRNSDIDQRVLPQVYAPASWHPERAMAIVVRAERGDPLQLAPAIRAQAAQLEPNEPIFGVSSMEQVLFDDLAGTLILAALLGAIAFIALCLAAVGIYGVVSYSVTQRTREIGVRMALGAYPGAVVRMVVGQSAQPVVIGGLVGLAVALGLAYMMATAIGEIDVRDPTSYVTVILSIVFVAFSATYLPARRASRVDPVVALRAE